MDRYIASKVYKPSTLWIFFVVRAEVKIANFMVEYNVPLAVSESTF